MADISFSVYILAAIVNIIYFRVTSGLRNC